MKLHIFVATTQGLVAIQNITPIDDIEINSIVTVNGTSTTANISSAYHGFVKKGAGIIQQDFGGGSYRVNLSERIDSGNSWQLAFYLAHKANAQGILGDGQVKADDQVICATGEINTSNRLVQAVAQVGLKQTLAEERIQQWLQLSAKVVFLIPQENQSSLNSEQKVAKITRLITTLEEALNYMPVVAASKSGVALTARANNLLLANEMPAIEKKSSRKTKLLLGLFVVAALTTVFFVHRPGIFFSVPSNNQTNANGSQINNGSTVSDNNTKEDKNLLSGVDAEQISLVATLAKYGDCGEGIKQSILKQGDSFAATQLLNLCQLLLIAPNNVQRVLLVAADTHAIRLLTSSDLPANGLPFNKKGWQIPLPLTRDSDRHYFLLLLPENSSQSTSIIDYPQRLHDFLLHQINSPLVKISHLQQWLNKNKWHGAIISHTLYSF